MPRKLTVLSLHPKILRAADYMQDGMRIRYIEDRGYDRDRRSLCVLLRACPKLAELEIRPDSDEINDMSLCK